RESAFRGTGVSARRGIGKRMGNPSFNLSTHFRKPDTVSNAEEGGRLPALMMEIAGRYDLAQHKERMARGSPERM
ncbi:hypothetical protein ACWDTP_07435, partial [Mycobacterium sp. NPDC003449]